MTTTLNIDAINDALVKKSAENADRNLSGEIEEREISCFLQECIKNKCDGNSVMQYVGKDPDFDTSTLDKIKNYEEITKLQKDVENKQKEVDDAWAEWSNMQGSKSKNIGSKIGITVGGLTGLGLAGYIIFGAAAAATGPVAAAVVGLSALASAVGSMFVGQKAGEAIGKSVESHDDKIAERNKQEYYKEVCLKVGAERDKLQGQLEYKLAEFNK